MHHTTLCMIICVANFSHMDHVSLTIIFAIVPNVNQLIASVMIEGGWLTHCGLVTAYSVRHHGQHLFGSWHVAYMALSACFKLCCYIVTWWRHQMETFSALLAICAGNSPVPGEFPTQRPVTQSFDVYFDLRPNKRLSKQSWGWWFETLSHPLWRHCNELNHQENFGGIWIKLHTFQLMKMSLSLRISKSIQHWMYWIWLFMCEALR